MRVVVSAALLDGAGRVLAARRRRPDGWEFPAARWSRGRPSRRRWSGSAGRSSASPSRSAPGSGPTCRSAEGWTLRAWTGRIVAGEPVAYEHAELRWVAYADLDALDWLPGDRPAVAALAAG